MKSFSFAYATNNNEISGRQPIRTLNPSTSCFYGNARSLEVRSEDPTYNEIIRIYFIIRYPKLRMSQPLGKDRPFTKDATVTLQNKSKNLEIE